MAWRDAEGSDTTDRMSTPPDSRETVRTGTGSGEGAAQEFVVAIAEPFLDNLIATNRVVPGARDKRRPLANEILAGGFENQFSRVVTAH